MIIEKMQLLAYQTADSTDLLRVLYVNPEMGIASLIPLKPRKIVPKIYDLLELELRFQDGEIRFVKDDPFEFRFWPDELFCEAHKLKRDETWALFSFHLQNHNGALYNPRRSKSYRRKMSEELCVKRVVVDRVVTRFLQGGEVPNALIPLYLNCGMNSDPSKSSKRGPQNAYEEILDLPRPSKLADDVIGQMLYCIEHYYLKKPKNSLNDAYNAFLEIYFESDRRIQSFRVLAYWSIVFLQFDIFDDDPLRDKVN